MIPADYITFNDDATAWWVIPDDKSGDRLVDTLHDFDRPCDTCGGNQRIDMPDYSNALCPDCDGAGRHTFAVCAADRLLPHLPFRTCRVHVDTLRQICDVFRHGHSCDAGVVEMIAPGCSYLWHDDGPEFIMLPAAAKPGAWVVKLMIHTSGIFP